MGGIIIHFVQPIVLFRTGLFLSLLTITRAQLTRPILSEPETGRRRPCRGKIVYDEEYFVRLR